MTNAGSGSATASVSVLVVDDDETFRSRLVRAFQAREFEAQGAKDGESAIALAKKESPEYAVVDLRMPGISGLDVVRELKEGRGLGRPMMETGRFPMLAVHMIQVGEETGRLDDMLMQVAETYDHEKTAIRRPTNLPRHRSVGSQRIQFHSRWL